MFNSIKSAFSLWNVIRGTKSSTLIKQATMPLTLIVIGSHEDFDELCARLGSPVDVARVDVGGAVPDDEGSRVLLDAAKLLRLPAHEFEDALGKIAMRHSERRITLAARVPAFRSAVVNQISHDRAYENAKFAALSALPGVIPLTDWLLPITSAGDLFVLTKNQVLLLLEVAACYGHPPETIARMKELLPVVGGAFGWRAIARELIGLVPGGVGVVVKASVAYAGTYSVGRAAAYFYSGQKPIGPGSTLLRHLISKTS